MDEYVALVNYNEHTLWITEGNSNNPRFFNQKELAEDVAKVFDLPYKIITKDEFINLIDGK